VRAEDARAQAQTRVDAARARVDNAEDGQSDGGVGDFPCGTHHIYCYTGEGGTSDCQQIGDLGEMCFHFSVEHYCTPCDGWDHFDNECNTGFAAECAGNCYAKRNDYCTCLPQGSSCTGTGTGDELDCCSYLCDYSSEVGIGVCA